MWEIIVTGVVVPLVGYAVDRWGYKRQIDKAAKAVIPLIPDRDVRKVAEQAVIAANQKEIERQVRIMNKRKAEHEVRLAAIKAGGGDVNVGNLKD